MGQKIGDFKQVYAKFRTKFLSLSSPYLLYGLYTLCQRYCRRLLTIFIEYSAPTRDFDYNRYKGMKNTTDGYWAQARVMSSLRIRRVSRQQMGLLGQSSEWQVPANGQSTLSAADANITK
jgi:hypothetical protein